MPTTSRTFRIFVSSTFSDLVAERNALQERVFPRLCDLAAAHGCRFQAIDLRWGVSNEASLDQQAMNICLGEIARCQQASPRPNFIMLLGDRYGWCPPPSHIAAAVQEAGFATDAAGKSVTALEIEFGILQKDPTQRRRSLFYFREPLPYDRMAPEVAATYSDAHSPYPEVRAGDARLQALKQRIAGDPELGRRVRHYDLGWDPESSEVSGLALAKWGRQVIAEPVPILDLALPLLRQSAQHRTQLAAQVAKKFLLAALRNPQNVVLVHPFRVGYTAFLSHAEPPCVYPEWFTLGRFYTTPGSIKLFKSSRPSRGPPILMKAHGPTHVVLDVAQRTS